MATTHARNPTTGAPVTKLSILENEMRAGHWHEALRIASRFPRLGEHNEAITRAWQAIMSPEMYRQMGRDPQALVEAGIVALKQRYPL